MSATTPSVSVVIPTYNRHAGVLRAARSALVQTAKPLEVIIVDDGSSEDKSHLREECEKAGIRLVEHEHNKGGSAARNTGVDAARGDWIALLDSDDVWVPDKLERQFRELGKDINRQDIFAASNILMLQPDGSTTLQNKAPPSPDRDMSEYFLIDGCSLQTSSLLLPAALARRTRFDTALPRHQDWDFVLRLVRNGAAVSYIHDPLVHYDNQTSMARVSLTGGVGPTLEWFDYEGDLITARAKHIFYFNALFNYHYARDRVGALWALARLSVGYPLGVPRTIVRLTRRVAAWAIEKAQRPSPLKV